MSLLEPIAVALLSLLFFGLALGLIVDVTRDATRKRPVVTFFTRAGGPWAWIGAFTLCGAMGAAKALLTL